MYRVLGVDLVVTSQHAVDSLIIYNVFTKERNKLFDYNRSLYWYDLTSDSLEVGDQVLTVCLCSLRPIFNL